MATDQQTIANKNNAAKSTGPKTKGGKASINGNTIAGHTARAAYYWLPARKAGGISQQSGAYFRLKTGADGPVLLDSLKNQSPCSTCQ